MYSNEQVQALVQFNMKLHIYADAHTHTHTHIHTRTYSTTRTVLTYTTGARAFSLLPSHLPPPPLQQQPPAFAVHVGKRPCQGIRLPPL